MIAFGYGLAKSKLFDEASGKGISRFVFTVAIPALLFRTMVTMESQAVAPWDLWLAYFGGLAVTWVVTAFASRYFEGLRYSGGAVASMGASFGNLVMLGAPLAISHFGPQAAIPLGMVVSIHAPILWFVGMLHREFARHSKSFSILRTGREVFVSLNTNPIVLALIGGSLWRLTGLGIHPVIDKMLQMLSAASVPTALFALGVSLAGYSLRGAWSSMFLLIGLKMALTPVLVFFAVHYLVELPPMWEKVAVLLAAMPTGANAFLFAQRNEEAVPAVSGAIALGTGLAAISASILLYLMERGVI